MMWAWRHSSRQSNPPRLVWGLLAVGLPRRPGHTPARVAAGSLPRRITESERRLSVRAPGLPEQAWWFLGISPPFSPPPWALRLFLFQRIADQRNQRRQHPLSAQTWTLREFQPSVSRQRLPLLAALLRGP